MPEAPKAVDQSNLLLKNKYNLQNSFEVATAAKRTEKRTGAPVEQEPLTLIQNYLDRFREITDRTDPEDKERGMKALKRVIHDKYIIKPDEIPNSYWENQQRIAREQGHGNIEITPEARDQAAEIIVSDQKSSLDRWIDYLASDDAASAYPDAARYWVFREVLKMSTYDKENKRFRSRESDEGKTAPFPDLNREALATAIDVVVKRVSNASEYEKLELQIRQTRNRIRTLSGQYRRGDTAVQPELVAKQKELDELRKNEDLLLGFNDLFSSPGGENDDQKRNRLLQRDEIYTKTENADFASLYAWAIEKVTPASEEQLATSSGEWVKYDKGSDHMQLVQTLQGHGTGWCTAGESTAKAQLDAGDFYVYYSHDQEGKKIPRVAIRMEGSRIAEVRGVAADQNLDGGVIEIAAKKLQEFPDGKKYQKKASDMKILTEIEDNTKAGIPLNATQLAFLHEVDARIEGFGYFRDPRIEEYRRGRDLNEDMLVIFNCELFQVANEVKEIGPETRAYVGPIAPGLFKTLADYGIEHAYTSFPEGKIIKHTVEIGGLTKEQLLQNVKQSNIKIKPPPTSLLDAVTIDEVILSPDFTILPSKEAFGVVRLEVRRLDKQFSNASPQVSEVYKKAQELGLRLCPPELGIEYRQQYYDQQFGEEILIGMEPIAISNNRSCVFSLRTSDQSWLDINFAENRVSRDATLAFCLPLNRSNASNP